jgi:hypothetical protein
MRREQGRKAIVGVVIIVVIIVVTCQHSIKTIGAVGLELQRLCKLNEGFKVIVLKT